MFTGIFSTCVECWSVHACLDRSWCSDLNYPAQSCRSLKAKCCSRVRFFQIRQWLHPVIPCLKSIMWMSWLQKTHSPKKIFAPHFTIKFALNSAQPWLDWQRCHCPLKRLTITDNIIVSWQPAILLGTRQIWTWLCHAVSLRRSARQFVQHVSQIQTFKVLTNTAT